MRGNIKRPNPPHRLQNKRTLPPQGCFRCSSFLRREGRSLSLSVLGSLLEGIHPEKSMKDQREGTDIATSRRSGFFDREKRCIPGNITLDIIAKVNELKGHVTILRPFAKKVKSKVGQRNEDVKPLDSLRHRNADRKIFFLHLRKEIG